MNNKISDYLNSEQFIGLDRLLVLQRRFDGSIAARLGILDGKIIRLKNNNISLKTVSYRVFINF